MVGTKLKSLISEDTSENRNQIQVKKMTVPSNEAASKRAAFGDLQNRGVTRAISVKDAAQKDMIKECKLPINLPNVVRAAKARVDTHWIKDPLGNSNVNAATKGPLGRSNSVRTNAQANKVEATEATSKITAKPKPGSNEQVNVVGTTTLKREDSNLSQKTLTKLRAALAKPTAGQKATVAVKKEQAVVRKPSIEAKKENVIKSVAPVKSASHSPISLSTKRLMGIEDIDAEDGENLVLVSEYVNDIYDYLYQVETEQPIHEDHLSDQIEVSPKMRAVLVDWINEVHLQFHLVAETFHMAVAIIDRYLQVVPDTKRSYLQLVGVTALFIATKYEELYPPAIGDFVFITDDTYTARQIRQMELQILKAINCTLSRPLPIHFLRRFSKAAAAEDAHHAMAKYFLELASLEYDLATYKPSEIAAASLFLSLHLLNGNARAGTGFNDKHWTPTLAYYSRYTAAQLRPITRKIAKLARNAGQAKLRAVYTKYQSNKFQKIALRTELYGALMDSIVASGSSSSSLSKK